MKNTLTAKASAKLDWVVVGNAARPITTTDAAHLWSYDQALEHDN